VQKIQCEETLFGYYQIAGPFGLGNTDIMEYYATGWQLLDGASTISYERMSAA